MSHRIDEKRKAALARNMAWAKLTPVEQLAELDKRGVAAVKQRAKIQKKIGE